MKKCLKTRILPFVCLLVLLITALVVPIGAEVTPPTPPTYTPTYDYPGANLIPYPYRDFSGSNVVERNGVTFTLEDYGIIVTGGDSTSHVEFLLANIYVDAGTYTVSGSDQPVILYCVAFIDGSYYDDWSNATFTLPEPALLQLRLEIPSGRAVSTTIYPMLNKGSTAYEYQPYLPYYFQQAFNDGWNQSYDRGYYAGQDDAFEVLHGGSMSVVTQAYYTAIVQRSNPTTGASYTTFVPEYTPNFTSNGVFFKSLWQKVDDIVSGSDPDWSYVDRVTLVLTWDADATFNYNEFPLFLSGNALVDSGRVITTDGMIYTLSADTSSSNSIWQLKLPSSVTTPVIVEQIEIYVGRPYDLLQEVYITSGTGFFDQGFDIGYAEGFTNGVNKNIGELRDEFYNQGYKSGFSVGKQEGIKIAEDGTFTNLMTAVVDAPVKAITGLLNFEILGQNMLSFMGSLLSLSLVLFFIKKAVL